MWTSRELWITPPNLPGESTQTGSQPALLDELESELQTKLELIEKEDYASLVDYLEEVVERRPDDAYAAKDLGEAYVLQGEAGKALELLAPWHRRHPRFEDVQWVILDALFASGRDERSFEWVEEPTVVRLGAETVDLCYDFSHGLDTARDVADLYSELLCEGYCAFSEEQLLAALRSDRRFVVVGDEIGLAKTVGERPDRSPDGRASIREEKHLG